MPRPVIHRLLRRGRRPLGWQILTTYRTHCGLAVHPRARVTQSWSKTTCQHCLAIHRKEPR